jgi:hypothetical protein
VRRGARRAWRFFTGILRDIGDGRRPSALIQARSRRSGGLKSSSCQHEPRSDAVNGVTGMLELLLEDSLTDQQRKRCAWRPGRRRRCDHHQHILDLSKTRRA